MPKSLFLIKNTHDWCTQLLFDENTELKKADGKPVIKKTKTDTSPSSSNFMCLS